MLLYRGRAEECWRNVWIFFKWQWENNEGLLIGGWEPHRDVASRCFQGRCGGRCCQSGWKSAVEPHTTWRELRLVDSGPFRCIKKPVSIVCYDTKVTLKVILKILSSRFVIFVAKDRELPIIKCNDCMEINVSKVQAWKLVERGHLSLSLLSSLPTSLWASMGRGRWGERLIYPLRHMTNRGGEIFIWEQHAGKWRE